MKSTTDRLQQRLTSELGTDAVCCETEALTSHITDGKQADLLCTPEKPEQLGTALRLCAEAEAAVLPWGGGTAMTLGNPPRQFNIVIGTRRLGRIIDHDPANLTVTVECGLPLARLQRSLSEERQFVPFDPPFPELSSIGGIVAASLNGPRRSYYGSVRDLVIGMKVILIDGQQIKAGGKVVKNVAGYDMCKLFVGSLGTLGVITEATLRLAPVPESALSVSARGTLSQARQFVHELGRSPLLPTALCLADNRNPDEWQVAVRCEGFTESVARSRRDLAVLSAQTGTSLEILSAEAHGEFWRSTENFPLQSGRLVFRVTLPRAEVFPFVQALGNWQQATIVADLTIGTIWLACAPTKPAVQQFSALSSMVRERRGHAMIFTAPSELKRGIDVWGEAPPALPLMRNMKQQFDPKGLLNPGRFLAGI